MSASFDTWATRLDTLSTLLETELTAIADALRATPTPDEVTAVVARIDRLRTRVQDMIP
jgi:aconitase B